MQSPVHITEPHLATIGSSLGLGWSQERCTDPNYDDMLGLGLY